MAGIINYNYILVYQLHNAVAVIKLALVDEDGTALPDNSKVAFVNNITTSIISSFKVYLNDKLTGNNTEDTNYKNYILTVMTYDHMTKLSNLQGSGFYEDTEGNVSLK